MPNRKATRTGEAKFSYVDARTILDTAKIYVGEMVQQDASLEVAPATDAASVKVIGVSTKEVDNTDDGKTLDWISTAVHMMNNSATSTLTKAHIGLQCMVEDAATVGITGVNQNVAGIVAEVTSDGVFVDFDPAKRAV